jgi:hypothetical protein
MDYVTMNDIHFSYDLLKIDGEDVEQYLNNTLNDISKTNDLDFIGQEEETMKGGSVMYEKFRDMVDYVKSTAIESITGRTNTLNDLLAPANKPVEGAKKQAEEVVPLEETEEKMKEERPMETPVEEVQKQEEHEQQEPEESDPEKKEERDEIAETDEDDHNIESTKKTEEEESTKEEVDENEDDELSNVSDHEDDDIIEKEVIFKPKNQDTLMEILELKMIKLLPQKEN